MDGDRLPELFVNVPATGKHNVQFAIFNAKGRIIGEWNLLNGSALIDLKKLPHGVYFGRVSGGTIRWTQKVIW